MRSRCSLPKLLRWDALFPKSVAKAVRQELLPEHS